MKLYRINEIKTEDAIETALAFIEKNQYAEKEMEIHGSASFSLGRFEFEALCKVLLVGVGELSK